MTCKKNKKNDLNKSKVHVTGIENVKKDGSKLLYKVNPSNIMIEEINIEDKERVKSIERNAKK